jgi:hypothetical protein
MQRLQPLAATAVENLPAVQAVGQPTDLVARRATPLLETPRQSVVQTTAVLPVVQDPDLAPIPTQPLLRSTIPLHTTATSRHRTRPSSLPTPGQTVLVHHLVLPRSLLQPSDLLQVVHPAALRTV